MARIRRKKKRTHRDEAVDPSKKGVPKSFVWSHGRNRSLVTDLQDDLRKVMLPHTALELQVSKNNVLKDFVHIAGPLGVSHFVILTATEKASYMKLCKTPRGPTVVFRIKEYALIRDVQAALARPRMPQAAFQTSPLVVLHGFGQEEHMKLTAIMFQNMFPAINVMQTKLSEAQRVVLLTYSKTSDTISFRHYCVSVTPSGLSKGVKALVQRGDVPDLSGFTDLADYVERGGYGSESEGEEAAASRVTLSQSLGRGNLSQRTSRIKLHEIGPRMELEVTKVMEGMADGRVLHHRFMDRTPEQVAEQEVKLEREKSAKAERRRVQEENVRRKAKEKRREHVEPTAKRAREDEGDKKGGKRLKPATGAKLQWWEVNDPDAAPQERDDNAQYFRDEVGEEPDELFGAKEGLKSKPRGPAEARPAKAFSGGVGDSGARKPSKKPDAAASKTRGGGRGGSSSGKGRSSTDGPASGGVTKPGRGGFKGAASRGGASGGAKTGGKESRSDRQRAASGSTYKQGKEKRNSERDAQMGGTAGGRGGGRGGGGKSRGGRGGKR